MCVCVSHLNEICIQKCIIIIDRICLLLTWCINALGLPSLWFLLLLLMTFPRTSSVIEDLLCSKSFCDWGWRGCCCCPWGCCSPEVALTSLVKNWENLDPPPVLSMVGIDSPPVSIRGSLQSSKIVDNPGIRYEFITGLKKKHCKFWAKSQIKAWIFELLVNRFSEKNQK